MVSSRVISNYALKNYAHLFYLNGSALYLRAITNTGEATFDRELRDTYELFIGRIDTPPTSSSSEIKSSTIFSIPSVIRILIKLSDINDNAPKFYEPLEAQLSTHSPNDWPGCNRTWSWSQLRASNASVPLLVVRANDLDMGSSGRVEYVLETGSEIQAANFLLLVNIENGSVFLNSRFSAMNNTRAMLVDVIGRKYASIVGGGGVEVRFGIVARDLGEPCLKTRLEMRVNVVFDDDDDKEIDDKQRSSSDVGRLVFGCFKQTFYYFQIVESIQSGLVFGYVNSIENYGNFGMNFSQVVVVYAIVAGDVYRQFDIDYRTGFVKFDLVIWNDFLTVRKKSTFFYT